MQQWCVLMKDCRLLSIDTSKSNVRLLVSFTNAGIATQLLRYLSTSMPAASSSTSVRITAEQPRVQLLTGYVTGLPSRVMQYPYDGALEHRSIIFQAAPHVQWMDGLDTILSPTFFGRARLQFVVEPRFVHELFQLRERVKQRCGVSYHPRFYKLLNAAVQCCSFCLQTGHSKSRCNKRHEQQQQAQQAQQHMEDGTEPEPCCPTCHDFHPDHHTCQKPQAACTLCGQKDHIVTRCKLYKPREVEITEEGERQIQEREKKKETRLALICPAFTRDASVFSSHFPVLSRSSDIHSPLASSIPSSSCSSPSSAQSFASMVRPVPSPSMIRSTSSLSVTSGLPSPVSSPSSPSSDSTLLDEMRQMREEHSKQMQQMMQQQQQQQQLQLQQMQQIQQLHSDMQRLCAELAEAREKEAKAVRECQALKRKLEQQTRAAQQGNSKAQRTNALDASVQTHTHTQAQTQEQAYAQAQAQAQHDAAQQPNTSGISNQQPTHPMLLPPGAATISTAPIIALPSVSNASSL